MSNENNTDDDSILEALDNDDRLLDEHNQKKNKKALKQLNKTGTIVVSVIGLAVVASFAISFYSGTKAKPENTGGKTKAQNIERLDLSQKNKTDSNNMPKDAKISKATEAQEVQRIADGKSESQKTVLKGLEGLNEHNWKKEANTKPNTSSLRDADRSKNKQVKDNLSLLFSASDGLLPKKFTEASSIDTGILKIAGDVAINAVAASWGGRETSTSADETTQSKTSNEPYQLVENELMGATNSSSSPADPKELHGINLNLGKTLYGLMHVEINSDQPGPVFGKIYQSPLKGAELHGEYTLKDEWVMIRMNKMVYKGTTYPVSILAFDPNTKRPYIADDVDSHPEKWLYFTLASLSEGFLKYSTSNISVRNTDGSQVSETNALSGSDLTTAVVANVGQRALPAAESFLDVKDTVTVKDEKEVMFYLEADLEI